MYISTPNYTPRKPTKANKSIKMAEDNTPTVTARRRKPTQLLRIRLENARRLQGVNARTKTKRAISKAKRNNRETQEQPPQVQQQPNDHHHKYEIAPRVPKIKKNKLSHPPRAESKFKKRQRGKTWLPTHIFHAKRAQMTTSAKPLWRFAVPLSPTEKSYRPTHRARGARGAVAWDMSYMSTIQLEGTEAGLEGVLRAVGVEGDEAWGVKGRRWRAGTRSLETWVFEVDERRRPIAPVTLVWRARGVESAAAKKDADADVEMVDAGDAEKQKPKTSKQKKKPRERVFVRVHPSAFLQLWNDLLKVSKQQNPPVMVEDLRFEIGSIDITGPGATEALIATLQPVTDDATEPPSDSPEATWSSLLGVTNPSSLPQNALLAFSISDPRLHFPPRRLPAPKEDDAHMNDLAILLSSWPPDKSQPKRPPALFDRPARLAATRHLPTQKAINRRRTLTGPGTYPAPQPSDPRIPVLLLARRSGTSSSTSNNNNLPGTWTILLPWNCVLAVWYSLLYYPLSSGSNPRFGGLREYQQLAFEAGEPWFPGDFPGTRAGWEWNVRVREEARREWERKPRGRRVEFDSLDLGNGRRGEVGVGWACDWEWLVRSFVGGEEGEGLSRDGDGDGDHGETKENRDKRKSEDSKTTTNETEPDDRDQKGEPPTSTSTDAVEIPPLNIHHLPQSTARRLLNTVTTTTPNPNPKTNIPIPIPIPKATLMTVKFTLLSRGTPTPRARVYRLPTSDPDLRQKWLDLATSVKLNRLNNRQPHTQKRKNTQNQTQDQKQNRKQQQQQPSSSSSTSTSFSTPPELLEESRRRLAASLITSPDSNDVGGGGGGDRENHPPIPTEDDLIGFVTTGNFNLSEGKGSGVGSVLVWKVLGLPGVAESERDDDGGEGASLSSLPSLPPLSRDKMRLCIIRESGERVGRLGVWDVV